MDGWMDEERELGGNCEIAIQDYCVSDAVCILGQCCKSMDGQTKLDQTAFLINTFVHHALFVYYSEKGFPLGGACGNGVAC
jgi:hypothetical protein